MHRPNTFSIKSVIPLLLQTNIIISMADFEDLHVNTKQAMITLLSLIIASSQTHLIQTRLSHDFSSSMSLSSFINRVVFRES